ncbi:MAG: hypothetical protein K0R25_1268 [Rickettsiaceae bacterium]|jgi:uncharacterized membrane protein YagU involved in acid resistance|nr:hypothetical protein [Rickettsiaceae bacterium]
MPNNETTNNSNVKLKAGLISGFAASAISSIVLILSTILSLVPEFNFVSVQGSIFHFTTTLSSAWVIYFLIGTFIWGSLYAVLEPHMEGGVGKKGLIFGILVWLIVMLVLMPLTEAGMFAKKYGFVAAGITLVTDLIFGWSLAYFHKKLKDK